MSESDIRDAIEEEYKIKATTETIKRLIQNFSVKTKEIIYNDDKFAEIYESAIIELVSKIKENLSLIDDTRAILKAKMDVYSETASEGETLVYIKELLNSIKVQNDTIKTMNGILQRLERETKETTISATKTAQFSVESLKELEDLGMITITNDYYLLRDEKKRRMTREDNNEDGRDEEGKTGCCTERIERSCS